MPNERRGRRSPQWDLLLQTVLGWKSRGEVVLGDRTVATGCLAIRSRMNGVSCFMGEISSGAATRRRGCPRTGGGSFSLGANSTMG